MKYRKLNVKILYRRCKRWQKSLKLNMITLSVVLNMYVLAVINYYGIGHLWSWKCEANKYPKCSETLLKACLTTTTSIDNTKWICSTCDSNLSYGKLPDCSKTNKMWFLVKPQCLNLTPLEERLISPCIPFKQIRELPRGGQLSIHDNVDIM